MKAGSEMDFKWGGFWLVSLTFFVMSTGSFEGLAISKLCNKVASVSCVTCRATEIPGYILLPLPNGIHSKF